MNQGPPNQRPSGPNHRSNNRRRFYRGKNRNRPPRPSLDKLYEKYQNFLDQHIIARKKFHDYYYRADDNQIIKLEKNFYQTLHDLREFEKRIPPELKASFEQRNNGLSLDLTYSTNHNIDPKEEVNVNESDISDPHYLESQKKAEFTNDKEESIGSIEDYLKYKNL